MSKENSTGFVTVACKMPNGMILRIFEAVNDTELVMGGGSRKVVRHVPVGKPVLVHGSAHKKGDTPDYRIVAGYALTEGVPADFWETWLAQNVQAEYVTSHVIFAYEKADDVVAASKDHESVVSGLHPLVPNNDARIPKGIATGTRT